MATETRVARAEREIASILAELERDTGNLVESIEVRSFDGTNIEDDRPQLYQAVRVEMRRTPGHTWGQLGKC